MNKYEECQNSGRAPWYLGQPRQTRTMSSANSKKSQHAAAGVNYVSSGMARPEGCQLSAWTLSRLLQAPRAKSTCRQLALGMCVCMCVCAPVARKTLTNSSQRRLFLAVVIQRAVSWFFLLSAYRKLAPKMPPQRQRLKQSRHFCHSSRINGASFWLAAKTTRTHGRQRHSGTVHCCPSLLTGWKLFWGSFPASRFDFMSKLLAFAFDILHYYADSCFEVLPAHSFRLLGFGACLCVVGVVSAAVVVAAVVIVAASIIWSGQFCVQIVWVVSEHQ